MNEEAFVRRREAEWARLTWLCDKAEGGAKALTTAELDELVRRYRSASSDLAVARTFGHHPPLIGALNDLVGRAYSTLYRRPRRSVGTLVAATLVRAARTVRRRRAFVYASLVLLLGSAFGAYFVALHNADFAGSIIPPNDPNLQAWTSGQFEPRSSSTNTAAWAMYASHNPMVSVVAGAVGAASFGILSATLMAATGAQAGVLASAMTKVGKLPFLIVSITPHGVTEISGAAIAAAGGLLLGWSVIDPGRRSRADALRAAGPDAGVMLLIGVALTLIAAPIEGFFSFNPAVPHFARIIVATSSLLAWLAFWIGFGRDEDEDDAAEVSASQGA